MTHELVQIVLKAIAGADSWSAFSMLSESWLAVAALVVWVFYL